MSHAHPKNQNNSEDVASSTAKFETQGAKTHLDVVEGTRRRLQATATIRNKNRLELMTKRRKENDSDYEEDDHHSSNNNNNNNNNASGAAAASSSSSSSKRAGNHRSHEPVPSASELYENIQNYVNAMNPNNHQGLPPEQVTENVYSAARLVRHLLFLEEPSPVPQLIRCGGLQALLGLLDCDDPAVVYEAVWSLTNCSTGNEDDLDNVMRAGTVARLVPFLTYPRSEKVRSQVAWCLANIAGVGVRHRQHVLDNGALLACLDCINIGIEQEQQQQQQQQSSENKNGNGKPHFVNKHVQTLQNCTWLLANLNRYSPKPPINDVAPALPTLHAILSNHTDQEVLSDALWAISYFSESLDKDGNRLQMLIDGEFMPIVLRLFHQSGSESMVLAALRCIGNFASNDKTTHYVFDWDMMPHLHQFLEREVDRKLRREACWLLSNCLCGTKKQINAVLQAGLIPPMVDNLGAPEFEVVKEAAWGLANLATSNVPNALRFLVEECGCLDKLQPLLGSQSSAVVSLALETLEELLTAGNQFSAQNNGVNPYAQHFHSRGGFEMLKNLTDHTSNDIHMRVANILQAFFDFRDSLGDEEGHGDYDTNSGDGENNNNNHEPNAIQPQQGGNNNNNNNNNNNQRRGFASNREKPPEGRFDF